MGTGKFEDLVVWQKAHKLVLAIYNELNSPNSCFLATRYSLLTTILILFYLINNIFAEPKFIPSIEAGIGVDDNLNYTSQNFSLRGIKKVSDVYFIITPKLQIQFPISEKNGDIEIDYIFKHNQYIKNENGFYENNYLRLNYLFPINKSIFLSFRTQYENFKDSEIEVDKYQALGFAPEMKFKINSFQYININYNYFTYNYSERFAKYDKNFIPLDDIKQKDIGNGVNIAWDIMLRNNFTTNITYSKKINSSNDDNFNYDADNILLNLWWKILKNHRINLEHQFGTRNYSNSQILSGIKNRKDTQNISTIKYEYPVTKNIYWITYYSYYKNDSNDLLEKYSKNLIYTGVKFRL